MAKAMLLTQSTANRCYRHGTLPHLIQPIEMPHSPGPLASNLWITWPNQHHRTWLCFLMEFCKPCTVLRDQSCKPPLCTRNTRYLEGGCGVTTKT